MSSAVLGVPSSAGAYGIGLEQAPEALAPLAQFPHFNVGLALSEAADCLGVLLAGCARTCGGSGDRGQSNQRSCAPLRTAAGGRDCSCLAGVMNRPSRSREPGIREVLPLLLPIVLLGLSFAVVARAAGWSSLLTVTTSALVFSASAQFTLVSLMSGGATMFSTVASAGMVNLRFLAMGIAAAPSFPSGLVRRAALAQTINDASWGLAHQGGGRFDIRVLVHSTWPQYPAWIGGTLLGLLLPEVEAQTLGLDAVFPAFFLALLVGEVRGRRSIAVCLTAAAVTAITVPFTPVGTPVLLACVAALMWSGGSPA